MIVHTQEDFFMSLGKVMESYKFTCAKFHVLIFFGGRAEASPLVSPPQFKMSEARETTKLWGGIMVLLPLMSGGQTH